MRHHVGVTTDDVVSFCRVCNAMCGIIVSVADDRILQVRGDDQHPLSRGYTCPKGRALGAFHHHPARLDGHRRRIADPRGGATAEPVGGTDLIGELADLVRTTIAEHGPDSVGMYLASGSAFDTNGRRAAERFLSRIGSLQKYTATTIDTPCKPLVAELMGGWSGLTPIWDHEQSDLLLLFGTNPVVSHGHSNAIADPVRRLREFRERGGYVVVADPRRTETAAASDLHLRLRPGTDAAVLAHLVRQLLEEPDRCDAVRTRADGVEQVIEAVAPFTARVVAEVTGIEQAVLAELLAHIRRTGRLSALTGTGTSMSGLANSTEWLLWVLHIITDSSDRPGGMWFNPGHLMQFDTRSWSPSDGAPEQGPRSRPELPRRFGEHPCAALADEIEAGELRILFVVGGNPVTALPDSVRTTEALASLDALVVLDVVDTETTALASHVVATTGQLERADLPWLLDAYQLAVATQYTPAVVEPGPGRISTWRFFSELGAALGVDVLPRGISPDEADDDVLLDEILARSRSTPAAVRAARHGEVVSGAVHGWVHDRVLPGGRWRLAPAQLVEQFGADQRMLLEGETGADPSDLHAFVLIPQRRSRTMNSQLRDVTAPGGRPEVPGAELAGADCLQLGVADGDTIVISSDHGSINATVQVSDRIERGCVGLPHGWATVDVSRLTSASDSVDPLTGMVLQSGLPVWITPAGPGLRSSGTALTPHPQH